MYIESQQKRKETTLLWISHISEIVYCYSPGLFEGNAQCSAHVTAFCCYLQIPLDYNQHSLMSLYCEFIVRHLLSPKTSVYPIQSILLNYLKWGNSTTHCQNCVSNWLFVRDREICAKHKYEMWWTGLHDQFKSNENAELMFRWRKNIFLTSIQRDPLFLLYWNFKYEFLFAKKCEVLYMQPMWQHKYTFYCVMYYNLMYYILLYFLIWLFCCFPKPAFAVLNMTDQRTVMLLFCHLRSTLLECCSSLYTTQQLNMSHMHSLQK